MLYKIGVLKNIAKFTGKHLYQSLFFNKETLVWLQPLQTFFYKFCEISNNTLFYRALLVDSSESVRPLFSTIFANTKKTCEASGDPWSSFIQTRHKYQPVLSCSPVLAERAKDSHFTFFFFWEMSWSLIISNPHSSIYLAVLNSLKTQKYVFVEFIYRDVFTFYKIEIFSTSNCNSVVLETYLNHKLLWSHEALNCKYVV